MANNRVATCPPASRLWGAGGADGQPNGGAVSANPACAVQAHPTKGLGQLSYYAPLAAEEQASSEREGPACKQDRTSATRTICALTAVPLSLGPREDGILATGGAIIRPVSPDHGACTRVDFRDPPDDVCAPIPGAPQGRLPRYGQRTHKTRIT